MEVDGIKGDRQTRFPPKKSLDERYLLNAATVANPTLSTQGDERGIFGVTNMPLCRFF